MTLKDGWSFCIITDNNDLNLQKVVSAISRAMNERSYEVIIVGQSKLKFDKNHIYIPYIQPKKLSNINWRLSLKKLKLIYRIPVSVKKNIAAVHARYNKICMMHDYVILDELWALGFNKFNDDWDICSNKIIDSTGKRFLDWVVWDHPELDGPAYLDYDKKSPYQYVSGTYFCVKTSFYKANMLNPDLCWGEGEDVEWSKRIRHFAKLDFNPFSTVLLNKDKGSWSHEGQWKVNTELLKKLLK